VGRPVEAKSDAEGSAQRVVWRRICALSLCGTLDRHGQYGEQSSRGNPTQCREFHDHFSSLARLRAEGYFGISKVRALVDATYFAGLRKAGVPEE
jgi:hypothetical protein